MKVPQSLFDCLVAVSLRYPIVIPQTDSEWMQLESVLEDLIETENEVIDDSHPVVDFLERWRFFLNRNRPHLF